jgi:LytS/YehU family sensor histidine kinase
MPKPFVQRIRLAYYLAWIPLAALVVVVLRQRGLPWSEAGLLGVLLSVPYALVCGASYYMARALPIRRTRLVPSLLSMLTSTWLAGLLWAGILMGVAQVLPDAEKGRLAAQAWVFFGMGVAFFILSLVYHHLVLVLQESRQMEINEQEARTLSREAELKALKAQINPHFLFNSLNAIAALTSTAPDQARNMCLLLSDFLRASLQAGDKNRILMKQELELARTYLDIEKVRFSDRLAYSQQVDESCLGAGIPPLLLQPLVENAVKHGIADLPDGGKIILVISRQVDRLLIVVENPVDADSGSKPGSGRGLRIVEDRLRSAFGKDARLVITKREGFFRVELSMPASGGVD